MALDTLSPAARALLERRRRTASSGVENAAPDTTGHIIPDARLHGEGSEAPLSVYQQRLWLFDQLEPGNPVYNRARAFRLAGPLDVPALDRALTEIVRRHEVLRTSLLPGDTAPVQRVRSAADVRVAYADLRAALPIRTVSCEDVLRSDVARSWIDAAMRRPFDLSVDEFLRASVACIGHDEHVLLLVTHHVASDGWSDRILFAELGAVFGAFAAGDPSPLPELALQYADYAVWQRRRLASGALDADLAYWRTHLDGAPSLLDLPTDVPRSTEPAGEARAGRVTCVVPRGLVDALGVLGREEGATTAMTLLAAYQLLLARYSGSDDIVVGVPIAGRTHTELEPLIGFFSNTLPLRTDCSGNPTFRELLRRVRRVAVDGYAHQELPFDAVLDVLPQDRSARYTPIIQTMFNVRNMAPSSLEMRGLDVTPLAVTPLRAPVDVDVNMIERDDGMHCTIDYSSALWTESTAAQWVESFTTLLNGIAANPDARIRSLPLVTPETRRRMLVDWNATERPLPYEQCLHDLVEAQVRRTPDAIAVIDEDGTLTYAELDRHANALAHDLRRRGVVAETMVGVSMERSNDLVIALLAVLKAGGAYVPLDPSYPADRLAFMLEDTRAPVIIVDPRSGAFLPARRDDVIVVDAAYWANCRRIHGELPTAPPENVAEPDGTAYVIYTSGSTGRPKGVLNSHRGIGNRLLWAHEKSPLAPDDRVLQKTPFSFDVSVWEFFWPLMSGVPLVVARPEGHLDNAYLADLVRRQRVTTIHFVPSMLQHFVDTVDPAMCVSLRRVICSGEALPRTLERRFFEWLGDTVPGITLHNLYGPTEAAIEVSAWTCSATSTRHTVPIGRPIANTQLYVLDAEMEPVPSGVTGELYIGGVGVARGYLNRDELTRERFVPDPFHANVSANVSGNVSGNVPGNAPGNAPAARLYRTGDLARYDRDGVIEYVGRIDHQVKIQGVRIELGEIESVLAPCPGVRECAVVLQKDAGPVPRLVAYVVSDGTTELSGTALRQHVRASLPDVLVPAAFVVLPALPLTPNGKLDRRALPAPDVVPHAATEAYVPPRTPTETLVSRIWAEVLHAERVGDFDDFFALGGNSLSAAQLVARFSDALGVRVPIRMVFEHPTVRAFCNALVGMAGAPPSPLELVREGRAESVPLFFAHGDFNGGGMYTRRFLREIDPDRTVYLLHPLEPGEWSSMEAMAEQFLSLVRSVRPHGPYNFAGFCNGGLVVFEMARRVRLAGEEVEHLILLDAWSRNSALLPLYGPLYKLATRVGVARERLAPIVRRTRVTALWQVAGLPFVGPGASRGAYLAFYLALVRKLVWKLVQKTWRVVWRGIRDTIAGVEETRPTPAAEFDPFALAADDEAAWRPRTEFYARATTAFIPQAYDGPITVLMARDNPPWPHADHADDETRGWRRVSPHVALHDIPGDHVGIITTHAGEAGRAVQAILDIPLDIHMDVNNSTH